MFKAVDCFLCVFMEREQIKFGNAMVLMRDHEKQILSSVRALRKLFMPADITTQHPRRIEMYVKMTSFYSTDHDGKKTYIRAPATDIPDTCTDPAHSAFHGHGYWDTQSFLPGKVYEED